MKYKFIKQSGISRFRIIFFILFFSATINLFAQTEYVLASNPVYNFLERMETLHIIQRYNSLEIPKPRNEISAYLKEIITNREKLDNADKRLLIDFEAEFELELYGTLKRSEKLIGGDHLNLLSQGEKYLYFVQDRKSVV